MEKTSTLRIESVLSYMKPLVSVIVPIYKTEKYLPRCLDSLQQQSLSNIEILLIDDGSPDRCGKICEAYAAKDRRFKAYHQIHAGTSVARNLGIRMATSDYLMFADSDDWVHEDFCKAACECALKYQADVVKFGLQQVILHKLFGLQFKTINALPDGYLSHKELIYHMVQHGSSSCDKLFRKKLFDTVKFPESYIHEDNILHRAVYQAKRIYSINRVLYYYLSRPNSTTKIQLKKAHRDLFTTNYQRLQDLIRWKMYPPKIIDFEFKNLALTYCIWKKKDLSDPYYLFSSQTLRNTKTILKGFTWKRKILIILFKHCPPLFNLICIVCGKRE